MNQLATVERNLFDYMDVPEADRDWLRRAEDELRRFSRRMVTDSLTIGMLLQEAKARVLKRRFKMWLASNTGFSEQSAYRFMNWAKWFSGYSALIREHQERIDLCAMHDLAAPSVHPDSRAAAMAYLAEKKELPRAAAAELIAKHTPAPVKNPALFAKECDEPPPPTTTSDDRRFIESLQDLAKNNGPVMVDGGENVRDLVERAARGENVQAMAAKIMAKWRSKVTVDGMADADDPDDVTYSISIGVKLHASGRTLPEALDRLTGHEKTKPCTMCGTIKPLATGFTVKNGHADGYASECKTCSRARVNAAKKGQEAA